MTTYHSFTPIRHPFATHSPPTHHPFTIHSPPTHHPLTAPIILMARHLPTYPQTLAPTYPRTHLPT